MCGPLIFYNSAFSEMLRNGSNIVWTFAKFVKILRNFFHITLTYKKPNISLFYPYLYTFIYMSLFLNSFLVGKILEGGQLPPSPVPTATPYEATLYLQYWISRWQQMQPPKARPWTRRR